MRAGAGSPGWSRFRHARQAGWRVTARLVRRGAAPEHREAYAEREARLQALAAFDAAGGAAPGPRVLDVGCAGLR